MDKYAEERLDLAHMALLLASIHSLLTGYVFTGSYILFTSSASASRSRIVTAKSAPQPGSRALALSISLSQPRSPQTQISL